MLKIVTILATLLLSSSVFADPDASPYPGGAIPQNAGSSNPGNTNPNLGSKPTGADEKIKKDKTSRSSKDEAEMNKDLKEQGDDE